MIKLQSACLMFLQSLSFPVALTVVVVIEIHSQGVILHDIDAQKTDDTGEVYVGRVKIGGIHVGEA